MSKEEMEGAMKVTFNFSELHKTMADMKSSVWRMDKVDEQVKAQRLKKDQQLFRLMATSNLEERQAKQAILKQGGFFRNIEK